MPMLDVNVALTNPYTLDTFGVERRQELVDESGFSRIVVNTMNGLLGVVTPETGSLLDREANFQVVPETITVITAFALRGESYNAAAEQEFQPDVVIWRNNRFLVKYVQDYSMYGRGFTRALCGLIESQPNPPQTKEMVQ